MVSIRPCLIEDDHDDDDDDITATTRDSRLNNMCTLQFIIQ